MHIELTELSEQEFVQLDEEEMLSHAPYNTAFGVISNSMRRYKVGWQSSDIEPVYLTINEKDCALGIDLVFVIFEFDSGKTRLRLLLNYYFYDVRLYEKLILVATELEIIAIDRFDYTVKGKYALPDYYENMHFEDNTIFARCLNKKSVEISM